MHRARWAGRWRLGFKSLSDTLDGSETYITVFPQGYGSQWGDCGSTCAEASEVHDGKELATQDDLSFLTSMIAHIVKSQDGSNPSKGRVDAERVYATGFSMGCNIIVSR